MRDYLLSLYIIKDGGLYHKKSGKRAGHTRKDGYRVLTVAQPKRCQMLEHRAIWLMHYGFLPKELDHIDRDKSNNDLSNLREASRSLNNLNKDLQKNNKSGCAGVYFYKRTGKYRAEIQREKVTKHIGYFNTLEEAILARKLAEENYGKQV